MVVIPNCLGFPLNCAFDSWRLGHVLRSNIEGSDLPREKTNCFTHTHMCSCLFASALEQYPFAINVDTNRPNDTGPYRADELSSRDIQRFPWRETYLSWRKVWLQLRDNSWTIVTIPRNMSDLGCPGCPLWHSPGHDTASCRACSKVDALRKCERLEGLSGRPGPGAIPRPRLRTQGKAPQNPMVLLIFPCEPKNETKPWFMRGVDPGDFIWDFNGTPQLNI